MQLPREYTVSLINNEVWLAGKVLSDEQWKSINYIDYIDLEELEEMRECHGNSVVDNALRLFLK